jgi:hypothetical protein
MDGAVYGVATMLAAFVKLAAPGGGFVHDVTHGAGGGPHRTSRYQYCT